MLSPLPPHYRVATIIVSYYNETILSQLGDLETYIASYITDKRDQLSVEAIRIASGIILLEPPYGIYQVSNGPYYHSSQ